MTSFQPGATYSGFVLERSETIAEIDSTVFLFTHERLATPVLAIKNSDPNKTFCIAFNTLPEDSTGVAHILEHSVLMGSKKYPVKDVFGEINKGGLMTFLNAMTGSDTTYYPFATRNMREYFNIMDVYCDVTLHPLLHPTTFEQEGWHYHQEGPDQPLEFQGVVFNEMKGAYSDPIRAIFHNAFSGLLPGSTYAHESGGDPARIPDLTYEAFVDFHRRYYHPSNAFLFFYGDAPLEEELAFVHDRFLRHFPTPGQTVRPEQGRLLSSPTLVEDCYSIPPGSDPAGKTYLAVASAVGTVREREATTAFQVIAQILYNSDASPLKKAVIEAGLCKDFGGLFLSSSCFHTIMMTYLIGSEPENRLPFSEVYETTLREMVEKGLDHELVLSELNKYEFSVRESFTKAQRGLDMISKALTGLKYDTDPFLALRTEDLLREIRSRALQEGYFEELISDSLLANPSTVEIVLRPDPDKSAREDAEERKRLERFAAGLDEAGRQEIIRHTTELIALQNQPNDETTLALLPRLERSDLDPSPPFHEVVAETLEGHPLLISELATNGISYIDFGLDCSVVPTDLLPLLTLFGTIITEIGTDTKDYMQFARETGTYTGGIDTSFNTYSRWPEGGDRCRPVVWLHLKALNSFLEPALELVGEIFSRVSFTDRKHIREIVLREFAWAEHSVQSEGYSLASSRAFSHLSDAGRYNEYVNGVTSYLELKKLAEDYDRLEDDFIARLEELRRILFRREELVLSITSDRDGIDSFRHLCPAVLGTLSTRSLPAASRDFTSFDRAQGFCTSAEVVFNVQAGSLFHDPELYNGHFEVLKTWISRDYLWNTVRQMGGAYGCFVQFNHITGNIGFVSYRDPHVERTFSAYDTLMEQISDLEISLPVLDQLIIGTYGSLVPHQSPAAMGAAARNEYLSGITAAFKRDRLREVLATTPDSLRSFAPLFKEMRGRCYRASIGSGRKIRDAAHCFTSIVDL
ncbi:MAG: insulinase family protein [Desulfobulbaceae bacterium]